jgi:hypothetical protein
MIPTSTDVQAELTTLPSHPLPHPIGTLPKGNPLVTTLPHIISGSTLPLLTKVSPPEGIDAVLEQRGSRYGKFTGHAKITQDLKDIMHAQANWKILTPDMKESLEMIAHKMGRILNGDPTYDDSWIDIGGYAKLVADRLTTGKEV